MNVIRRPAIFLTSLLLWSTYASADLEQVAAYLNKVFPKPVVEVRGQALVAPKAKKARGHFIEDCRRAAIRQSIMDASALANGVVELSRKGSHRLKITGRETENNAVGALVGVRIITNGTAVEKTFSYLMDDPEDGTCAIVKVDAPVDGMISRKAQEKKILQDVLPKLPADELETIRADYAKKKGSATNEDIAKKSVTKLIHFECEQYSMNQTTAIARAAFQAEYPGAQPIVFLDFVNSDVASEVTPENKDAELKTLKGSWTVRMSDITAQKTMTAKVSFDLKEGEDECVGTVNPQAEIGD